MVRIPKKWTKGQKTALFERRGTKEGIVTAAAPGLNRKRLRPTPSACITSTSPLLQPQSPTRTFDKITAWLYRSQGE